MQSDCTRAERLAGAIAIGEAGDEERNAYRAHLAACPRCLHEMGGEREIERVMETVALARDVERWEPQWRATFVKRRLRRNAWAMATALAAALIVVVGVRAMEKPQTVIPPQNRLSQQEARAIAALDTQTAPRPQTRAESLAVGPATTVSTAFEITLDERGLPLRCTITKSSGFGSVDRSVCRAAMHARYASPTRR